MTTGARGTLPNAVTRTCAGYSPECAQHYAAPPKVSRELSRRQEGQSPAVRALSWRAQNRLHQRYTRLLGRRLHRNKAIVAIARELCGFIWELLRTQSCYEAPATSD